MEKILETTNFEFFRSKVEGCSGEFLFKRRKPNEKCGEIINQIETLTLEESEIMRAYLQKD